jgi:hypothetical protein
MNHDKNNLPYLPQTKAQNNVPEPMGQSKMTVLSIKSFFSYPKPKLSLLAVL